MWIVYICDGVAGSDNGKVLASFALESCADEYKEAMSNRFIYYLDVRESNNTADIDWYVGDL